MQVQDDTSFNWILLSHASLDAETFNLRCELGDILNGGVIKKSTIRAGDTESSVKRRWIAAEFAIPRALPEAAGHTGEVLAPGAAIADIHSWTMTVI